MLTEYDDEWYDDGDTWHGCLKCSREEVYRNGLCRRHHNIEKILAELVH